MKPPVKAAAKKVAANATPAKTPAPKAEAKQELMAAPDESFLDDAGAGSESMGKDDLAIPRLTILQALSPACQKRENTYVEGAEPGEIFDTVGLIVFPGEAGIRVIPCTYSRKHIEWKPRSEGGGFVADHGPDPAILATCTRNDKGQYINKVGNAIVPTAEYFVLIYDDETGVATPYVLSMSGAQLKHSRRWNTIINTLRVPSPKGGTFNPAMFYRSYQLTTAPESNDQGSWFGWSIKGVEMVPELPGGMEVYAMAKAFRNSVMEGTVKAAAPVGDHPASEDDNSPM